MWKYEQEKYIILFNKTQSIIQLIWDYRVKAVGKLFASRQNKSLSIPHMVTHSWFITS